MIETKKAIKEALFIKNRTLFELIYYIGEGVMFVKQISEFLDQSPSRLLKNLQDAHLIDIKKIHNNNLVRLKQYSLSKISSKELETPRFTKARVFRSAFVSEIMLRKLMTLREKKKGFTLERFITLYKSGASTNLLWQSDVIFAENMKKRLSTFGASDFSAIDEQIQYMKLANKIQRTKNKGVRNELIEERKNFLKDRADSLTTLAMLRSSSIYIETLKKNLCKVAILATSDGPLGIVEKMQKAFYCFSYLLGDDYEISFNIYVIDSKKERILERNKGFITNKLISKHLSDVIEYEIVNLNLTKTIFSNKKILV